MKRRPYHVEKAGVLARLKAAPTEINVHGVGAWVSAVGYDFDCLFSAFTGGIKGTTVSLRVAEACCPPGTDPNYRKPSCWVCWWLSHTVQKDHCQKQFTDEPTPSLSAVLAGVQFTLAIGLIGFAAYEGVRWLRNL